MIKKIFNIIIITFLILPAFSQIQFYYPYYPDDNPDTLSWNWEISAFGKESSNSSAFTNDFFSVINKSQHLDADLINKQIEQLDDHVITGQIRNIGIEAIFNSEKDNGKKYFYFGIEHQHYLDTYLDKDLVNLLLLGNKPFAGKICKVPGSEYYGIYFNQIKGGVGYRFKSPELRHCLTWDLALNIGQNYDFIKVRNSSLYTHPDGDYLEIETSLETKLSDTVWAEVYQMNGLGLSADLEYSIDKPDKFHIDININNLGFLFWAGNTFIGEMDTCFIFEGVGIDTITEQENNLPDDYSYEGLRRLLFKDPESSSFLSHLPLNFRFSAGKYFVFNRFYAGFNSIYYPFSSAKIMFEVFATYNYHKKLFITPVVLFGSYGKLNYGLNLGLRICKKITVQMGSGYLNSFFNKEEILGKGGFVRITFRN